MKCLNPGCGGPNANEINVSVNVTETTDNVEYVEYTGDTEMGDTSDLIGTFCTDCGVIVYVDNWEQVVLNHVGAEVNVVVPATVEG